VEQHLVGVGAGGGVGSGAGAGEDLEAAVLGARHRLRRRLSQSVSRALRPQRACVSGRPGAEPDAQ
jgi:hypothetical protein